MIEYCEPVRPEIGKFFRAEFFQGARQRIGTKGDPFDSQRLEQVPEPGCEVPPCKGFSMITARRGHVLSQSKNPQRPSA